MTESPFSFVKTSPEPNPFKFEVDRELPKNMQEILDRIPSQVPENFKKSAKLAAQYILDLDAGISTDDEGRERFKQQISHTGFIAGVYVHYAYRGVFTDAPNPKDALPTWIYNEKAKVVRRDEEKDDRIQAMYDRWSNKPTFKHHKDSFGYFSDYPNPDHSTPVTHNFKTYIEGKTLEEGLTSGDIPEVLHKLGLENLNPNTMKLFENSRLVLYFGRDVKLAPQIRKQFKDYGLDFRGPAQDVYEVRVNDDGEIELDNFTSNDGSLGEGGHTVVQYNLKKYDPAEFLDNYLQLCLYAGKDPSEPYKTSFVWFMDREGKAKGNEQMKVKAEKLAAYPVLYARHRLDLVRR